MSRRELCPPEEEELRPLSAWEVLTLRRESLRLAAEERELPLCANACLVARVLRRRGRPVYPNGRAALKALPVEEITRLADRWGERFGPRPGGVEQGFDPGFDRAEYERRREEERP